MTAGGGGKKSKSSIFKEGRDVQIQISLKAHNVISSADLSQFSQAFPRPLGTLAVQISRKKICRNSGLLETPHSDFHSITAPLPPTTSHAGGSVNHQECCLCFFPGECRKVHSTCRVLLAQLWIQVHVFHS